MDKNKSKYIEFKRLNNLMDTAIRDAEIRAFWGGLSHTKLGYKDKIDLIVKEYYISRKVIEAVIKKGTK